MLQNESMAATLLKPLNQLHHLSQTLFLSLSPAQSKPPPLPSSLSLIKADADLATVITIAHTHQAKQSRIEALKEDVLHLDQTWRVVCAELETGRKELEIIIEECEERLGSIESAKLSIPYPELLAYAQSLSAFTSAPPNMPDLSIPGLTPPLFFPPFPNEEKMRRGRLNAEAPLGLPGETHSVGRRKFFVFVFVFKNPSVVYIFHILN